MRTLALVLASLALIAAAPARADAAHDALEAYALYQNDVSVLLDLDVDSAQVINGALIRLSRHDPARVARGFIAYGALTAAQSPSFAASLDRHARDGGRAHVLGLLRHDASFARRAASGGEAIALILAAARADSARFTMAGARYDHLARASTAAWITSSDGAAVMASRAQLTPDMRERLRIGALAAKPAHDADAFGGSAFWDSLAGREARARRMGGARERVGYAGVTDRMLTVGALVVLGAGGRERAEVSALLDEPLSRQCLTLERLQLRQCLSVSVDASERTYCLGRHGLAGPGACFSAMVR